MKFTVPLNSGIRKESRMVHESNLPIFAIEPGIGIYSLCKQRNMQLDQSLIIILPNTGIPVGIQLKHHLLPADYMQDTCSSSSILFRSKFIRLSLKQLVRTGLLWTR
ncbi:hypothetical protein TNCT_3251 [Trichonephila clavata]|uniref:Uncharacterized protein n=1 Tax=Trichonephila clavata TaxID=2740835 RepID=A0A8X6LET3_TRICU|nr:hypothetical protein TNCT_3251 [Trichonephila clavata]